MHNKICLTKSISRFILRPIRLLIEDVSILQIYRPRDQSGDLELPVLCRFLIGRFGVHFKLGDQPQVEDAEAVAAVVVVDDDDTAGG